MCRGSSSAPKWPNREKEWIDDGKSFADSGNVSLPNPLRSFSTYIFLSLSLSFPLPLFHFLPALILLFSTQFFVSRCSPDFLTPFISFFINHFLYFSILTHKCLYIFFRYVLLTQTHTTQHIILIFIYIPIYYITYTLDLFSLSADINSQHRYRASHRRWELSHLAPHAN